jgi:4-hydroxybenzoate polyprenyltransferase
MTDADHSPAPFADGRVADATPRNWVDGRAPAWARPYLRLSRIDRPIGTWLLLIPCWWGLALAIAADPGSARPFDLWIAAGCGLGAVLMRGAGCTWNDLTDHDFDAAVARTRSRPLPSGQVSRRQAQVWMVVQALAAALILFSFPPFAIGLGIASLVLVAIYPFAKRFTWWPQVFLGLAFNWGALLGWAAHAGSLSAPPLVLYAAGIAWTLFYDTIYAHQDADDDALIGVRSTARLFGDRSPRWLFGFLVAATSLLGLAAIMATMPSGPLALLAAVGGTWAFGWHLTWQLGRLDIADPARCLAIFRANRDAGLLAALGLALAAAAAVLVPS